MQEKKVQRKQKWTLWFSEKNSKIYGINSKGRVYSVDYDAFRRLASTTREERRCKNVHSNWFC